ncbi:MAG: hypothetical protein Kow00129_15440 [Thermoleophilia bacterium]
MLMTTYVDTATRPSAKPLYVVSDLARLSQAAPGKVKRWLCGYSAAGREYDAFLRAPELDSRGKRVFTFENLIEVSLVSALRRNTNLSLDRIKGAYRNAEAEFGPYPFARRRVFVSGSDIFMHASEYVEGEVEHLTALTRGSQRASERVLEQYLTHIDWVDEWPAEWHPVPRVRLNPEIAFGQPNVSGIRTETLGSRFLAGEPMEFIAEDFALSLDEVEAAVRYELLLEKAA